MPMRDDTADIATLHDQYRVAIDTIPGLVEELRTIERTSRESLARFHNPR